MKEKEPYPKQMQAIDHYPVRLLTILHTAISPNIHAGLEKKLKEELSQVLEANGITRFRIDF